LDRGFRIAVLIFTSSAQVTLQTIFSTSNAEPSPRQPIVVERLVKEYRTQKGTRYLALQDVDFHVGRGEFVSVVGPSGVAKARSSRSLPG
jgi:ABC-type glutathione transport system ATPase component